MTLQLLHSQNVAERHQGVEQARRDPSPGIRARLVDMVMNDPVPGVSADAAFALGSIRDSALLYRFIKEPKQFQGDRFVRRRRLLAIVADRRGDSLGFSVLHALVHDDDAGVRINSYLALRHFSDERTLKLLDQCMAIERDPQAVTALKEAIRSLSKRLHKQ